MIKAILFDLDMTLIDFLSLKRKASNAAARAMVKAGLKMSVKKAEEELFKKYLQDIEGQSSFSEFLKEKKSYSERILAAAINAYLKTKYDFLKPYPNVKSTLIKFKKRGLKLGIVTDAPRIKAWQRLDEMKIADLFDFVIGIEDTNSKKPSPRPFKKALQLLKMKPSEVMHVGDWPERDILGAKKLGIKTCLAIYGYNAHKQGKYIKPDYKIDRFEDLLKINGVEE